MAPLKRVPGCSINPRVIDRFFLPLFANLQSEDHKKL